MARKNKFLEWAMWVVGVIASIGVGGLFVNGTMLNVFLLSWLGLTVHQIVGWAIIVSTAIAFFQKLIK